MVRYPHTLQVSWQQQGGYDGTSDYVSGEEQSLCVHGNAWRDKGSLISLNDGKQISYSWNFYCKPLKINIPYGAIAKLSDPDGDFWSGTVKGASKTQRGTQIWL